MKEPISYILVTPARNEEDFLEQTIKSVVQQTVLPRVWVIVSDGSTDSTDQIAQKYSSRFPWIETVKLPEKRERNFAAKVQAFNAGFEVIKDLNYDIIGNLDADITFDSDYCEFLLERFTEDKGLGVAGTPFVEGDFQYDYQYTNINHVSGACQLFRKLCFEEIGGYKPNPAGGIDWVAVTTARMRGWKTRTFTEKKCIHHRPIGTGGTSGLKVRFKQGQKDYFLGGHPLWQIFRSTYQMRSKPFVTGGIALLTGYFWSAIKREQRPVPQELIKFHRNEQMVRLKGIINRITNCFRRQVESNGVEDTT